MKRFYTNKYTYKPYFSYLHYLFLRIFKSSSTIWISVISWIFVFLLSMSPVFLNKEDIQQFIPLFSLLIIIFNTVFSGIFAIIKSLNVFQDCLTDGTELLVISKPISRNQILFGKFSFIFAIGIIYSLLNTIFIAIGFSIVGLSNYSNANASIFGNLGASLLSFFIFAVISISISLKFSGKTARLLPFGVLLTSSIITIIFSQVSSFFSFPTQDMTKKIQEYLNNQLVSNKIQYQSNDVTKITLNTPPLSYYQNESKSYFYIDRFDFETNVTSGSWYLYSSNLISDTDIKNIYNYVVNNIYKYLKEIKSISASGIIAINYINPVSAFASIANLSNESNKVFNTRSTPYNFFYSNFKIQSNVEIVENLDKYNSPSAIEIQAQQMDAPWQIAILWFSLFSVLLVWIIYAYSRKDFI